jgi:effector-binding domain-containing protein
MAMDVRIEKVAAKPTACVRVHTTVEHIGEAFDRELPKVASHVAEVGGVITGPPFTRYLRVGPEGIDMEVGFPTATLIPRNGEVTPAELPEVEAAVATHVGGYDGLPAAYGEIEQWIRARGRVPDTAMWEVYLTDPGADPDTSHWRTQIVWPLKA